MNTAPPTSSQILAGIRTVQAVAEAVRELGQVPAGTLYAQLMSAGVTLVGFEQIIGSLSRAGLVSRRGDLLCWIGPQIEASRDSDE